MDKGKLNRRITISANISDYVYDFEKKYTEALNDGNSKTDPNQIGPNSIKRKLEQDGLQLVGFTYDPKTGVAGIAVKDGQTGETYIAYAGTNVPADGMKDPTSDAAIGLNDPLYLQELETVATAFYRSVQAKGYNITTTTGHSYGDFLASRVALVNQTPYKFGFQGAPQSVNLATYYETFYDQLIEQGLYTKEQLDILIELAKNEDKRVKQLLEEYTGYAATFSTTSDFLTNLVWEQGNDQIKFDGRVKWDKKDYDFLAKLGVKWLSNHLDAELRTVYVGSVIAIDVPIEHNMTDFRKSYDAMYYTQVAVLADITGIDFNRDGQTDFLLGADYTSEAPIVPEWATTALGTRIKLDLDALRATATNLFVIRNQLTELAFLTSQAVSANKEVMDGINPRREGYQDLVIRELENIGLVQSVKDIDSAFSAIVDIKSYLDDVQSYNTYDFTRKFDNLGTSVFYNWYDDSGATWNYHDVVKAIHRVSSESRFLYTIAEDNEEGAKESTFLWGLFDSSVTTNVAQKGKDLINSFKDQVREVTAGLGNRSSYEDGIPTAVGEVLEVIYQNLITLSSCVSYTWEVVKKIIQTMEEADIQLAEHISNLDLSQISPVDTTVSEDYNTYLESTGVFDDMSVIRANDDQIDIKAAELANSMEEKFSAYLSEVSADISTTNTSITNVSVACENLKSEMSVNVYYSTLTDKDKKFYGNVGSLLSISGTIRTLSTELVEIDTELTTASTIINTTIDSLGGIYNTFRQGAEEAIYGATGLDEIVKSQKAILEALEAMKVRFTTLGGQISNNEGLAIKVVGEKVDEIINLMGNASQLIGDCFGD